MLREIKSTLLSDPVCGELMSGALLLVWGVVLLLPADTFATSISYRTMAESAPEWAWAMIALFFGTASLYGIIKRKALFRVLGLHGGVFFWGTVGTCILFDNPWATGGWVYVSLGNVCAAISVLHKGRSR